MSPLLSMSGVEKAFSGVAALAAASLEIVPGEVHALIGQNGAGKSTLIKILTGVYRRDQGNIWFDGCPSRISSPREAQEQGISTIYQELNLVPLRSVTENVTMGYEPRGWSGFIQWGKAHRRTRKILSRFGIDADVRAPLGDCPTAIQQLVAIARAISLNAKLVIMDEPTSSLDDHEVEVLFGVIRALKESGVSVLYISHHLDELFQICDRVTVMRDGHTVACKTIAETNKLELIADMLGRDVGDIAAAGMTDLGGDGGSDRSCGELLLEADGIATDRRLKKLDLSFVGVKSLVWADSLAPDAPRLRAPCSESIRCAPARLPCEALPALPRIQLRQSRPVLATSAKTARPRALCLRCRYARI